MSRWIPSLLFLLMALASCGGDEDTTRAGTVDTSAGAGTAGKVRVVTTVAPLTSIAANVAGDRAEITGVVPEDRKSVV